MHIHKKSMENLVLPNPKGRRKARGLPPLGTALKDGEKPAKSPQTLKDGEKPEACPKGLQKACPKGLQKACQITIRELRFQDRDAIKHLLDKVHQFTDSEKECAVELMDICLEQASCSPLGQGNGRKDYEFLVAIDKEEKLCGFVTFGDISLTDACYDLYWIVCDPALQNNGIGTKLLDRVEEILKEKGIRKLFAETSSKADYVKTQSFYRKRGFKLTAQISDFYKIGDDKLIYVKTLTYAD